MPFHIDYQAMPFGHQYSFEWHILFEPDTLALSAYLWNAQLSYQILLFLRGYYLSIGSLAAKRIPSHSCVGSAIRSKPSQPTKTSTRLEI